MTKTWEERLTSVGRVDSEAGAASTAAAGRSGGGWQGVGAGKMVTTVVRCKKEWVVGPYNTAI